MINSGEIENIVKKYYNFTDEEKSAYSITFHVNDLSNERAFSALVDNLNLIGATVFTNDYPDNQIIVLNNYNISKEKIGVKLFLFALTVITMVYTGYTYYSFYYYSSNFFKNLFYGMVLFFIPLAFIIFLRECGKYIALKRNHMKYYFPIFIPTLGLGTLGVINSNRNQFKTQNSMIMTGSYSLILGFLSSLVFIIVGAYITPLNLIYNPDIYSPLTTLNFPFLYIVFINHIFPATLLPDPLELAGYAGLIITSINALPLGFLDGGLVFSGILKNKFKYFSYISIFILLIMSFVYVYFVIIVIIILLIGLTGPLPLNNVIKSKKSVKYLGVVVFVIIIFGFVPLPVHMVNSNESISLNNNCYIVNTAEPHNITFNVTVHGSNSVEPIFSMNPGKLKINSEHRFKNESVYSMEIPVSNNHSGKISYNLAINTGSQKFNEFINIYYVKAMGSITFNNRNPYKMNEPVNKTFTLSVSNENSTSLTMKIISIANNMDTYIYTNSGYLNITGEHYIFGAPITINSGGTINLSLLSKTSGTWEIMLYSNGNAGIVTIHIT